MAALAVTVSAVFPNPLATLGAIVATTVATAEQATPSTVDDLGDEDAADGQTESSDSEDAPEDDGGRRVSVDDDIVDHDDLLLEFASGDRVRVSVIGGARAGVSSRVPRPSGQA